MDPPGAGTSHVDHDVVDGARALADRMRSLVAAGHRAEALALYARIRDRLRESGAGEPPADAHALQAELLADAIRAVPRQRGPASAIGERDLKPLPPESRTSLVGRTELADSVIDLLGAGRVVTLHGPGGVGKTRLALRVAHASAEDGIPVAWVDLAPARDAEGALYAAADAIGVRDVSLDDPVGSLVRALGDEVAVVVVDNCEHLLDVAAHLVDGLQARTSDVRVLATSREPLAVDGERVVPVPSLALSTDTSDPDDTRSPALCLLDDRLATARGHGLDPTEHAAAAAIAERLDGLPLAIELAAGRAAALGLTQLRDRLGLDLLDRGLRTGSDRHRSLRSVVDWSYALLDDSQQTLFARLSVFAGAFSLARAEVVCTDERVPVARLPSLLSGLVDGSLVVTAHRGDERRHRLLMPLHEYAAEALAARGDDARWHAAHARHMADVAAARATAMHGPAEPAATDQLVEDLDDIRVALEHALGRTDVDTALRLVDAMHDLGSRQMRLEVLDWADAACALPGAAEHVLFPQVLGTAAKGRWLRRDIDGAQEQARQALASAPDTDDPRRARGLLALAESSLIAGRLDDAAAAYLDAVENDAAAGPATDAAGGLAMTLADLGRVEEGIGWADRALARAESTGAPSHLAWAWYAQARCWAYVDPAKAVAMLERSAELSRSVDNTSNEYSALTRILLVRASVEGPRALLADYRTTLQRWRRTGSTAFLSLTLRNLASLLDEVGRDDDARRLRSLSGTAVGDPQREEQLDQAYVAAIDVLDELTTSAQPQLSAQTQVPTQRPPDVPHRGTLRREGRLWAVGFDGREAHVPDSKGLQDLALLLSRPGVEVHCLDLVGPGDAPTRTQSDLGEQVDAHARSAYADRIRSLREQLDEEPDHADAERWQAELDFLVAELGAAYGLGKQPRRTGDPVEKARTAVTWRIKAALRRIAELEPPLGTHLKHAVRTGRYCVYAPDEPVEWEL